MSLLGFCSYHAGSRHGWERNSPWRQDLIPSNFSKWTSCQQLTLIGAIVNGNRGKSSRGDETGASRSSPLSERASFAATLLLPALEPLNSETPYCVHSTTEARVTEHERPRAGTCHCRFDGQVSSPKARTCFQRHVINGQTTSIRFEFQGTSQALKRAHKHPGVWTNPTCEDCISPSSRTSGMRIVREVVLAAARLPARLPSGPMMMRPQYCGRATRTKGPKTTGTRRGWEISYIVWCARAARNHWPPLGVHTVKRG